MTGSPLQKRIVRVLLTLGFFAFTTVAFQNCMKEGEFSIKQKYTSSDLPIGLYLEKGMSNNLQQALIGDLVWYGKREGFDKVSADSYAYKIFGETPQSHLDYLDERVNFALEGGGFEDENFLLLASNPSVIEWMRGLANGAYFSYSLDEKQIVFNSGRAGAIVFYDYAELKYRSDRVITLVHEARHSDCTGGLPASFVSSIGDFLDEKVETPNLACGHFHTECPSDHQELAGVVACDTHLWGAYSVGAVLGQTFSQRCSNCDESEKQVALAVAADSFSRVVNRAMISNGSAEDPDLGSEGVRQGE